MSEKTINRRDVLKYTGISLVGVGSSSVSAAGKTDKGSERINSQKLPYDIKVKNSGVNAVKNIVRIYKKDSNKTLLSEYKSPSLSISESSEKSDTSLDKGTYIFQVKSVFTGEGQVTSEKEISVPDGGIQDYSGIVISIFDKDNILISKVEV